MRAHRAFAIAAALCAVVIIAALITGAFFASAQETSATRLAIVDQQAFSIAELGASRALEGIDLETIASLHPGTTRSLGTIDNPPASSRANITRLDSALYLVVSEGRVNTPDARGIRRTVSILLRVDPVDSARVVVRRVREQAWTEVY